MNENKEQQHEYGKCACQNTPVGLIPCEGLKRLYEQRQQESFYNQQVNKCNN